MIRIFGNLVKKKTKAFSLGTKMVNELNSQVLRYLMSYASGKNINNQGFIGMNVVQVVKYIYENSLFYEYLKYSFLGKYYERRISSLKKIILIVPFLLLGGISYLIFKFTIGFYISLVVIVLILLLISSKLKTGESYESYYQRTMMNLLYSGIEGFSFDTSRWFVTDEDISYIIRRNYSNKTFGDNINFTSDKANGNMIDMILKNVTTTVDRNGNTHRYENKVFDGFYVKLNMATTSNRLRGNVIKILEDENLLSAIAEDTRKGIYESELEFEFNSEEMNKAFDGRISGYLGFNDVDEMMMEVQKIIPPTMEEHMLYLRKRYNSFNMNISDSSLVLSFNTDKTLFQHIKQEKGLFHKTNYREFTQKKWMISPQLNGINDFVYYNVFPFMERLYMINYYTYLYLNYMNLNTDYVYSMEEMLHFEEDMKLICDMNVSEFKELYTEKIKEIYKNVKENPNIILGNMEENVNG